MTRVPAILLALAAAGATAEPRAAAPDWAEVSTIFTQRCVMCHSGHGAAKGLRLDSYQAALAGSERGLVLVAGDATTSELVRRLRGESLPRMPFLSRPLPAGEIELIVRWIEAGLPATPEVQEAP